MNKHIVLVVIFLSFLFIKCTKDEMTEPTPDFEMFVVNDQDEEVIVESVEVGQTVYFRNIGKGDAYVVWYGEKNVKNDFAIKITNQIIENLQENEEISQEVADLLKILIDKEYKNERELKKDLNSLLGEDKTAIYDRNIFNASYIPSKDIFGNDSVAFKYNYDYNDYLIANQKGIYNVSGISLIQNKDNEYMAQFKYSWPGKRIVTFQAVGIGDFGNSVEIKTITKEIRVVLPVE